MPTLYAIPLTSATELCIVVSNMLLMLLIVSIDVLHSFLWDFNHLIILWASKDVTTRCTIKTELVVGYSRTTKLAREEYLFDTFYLLSCHTNVARIFLSPNNLLQNQKMGYPLNRKLILIYLTIL